MDHVLGLQQDVIACGPGLGRTPAVRAFVRALVERAAVPLVLDADALVAFDDAPDALAGSDERQIVITPHPGEMARLLGVSIEEVQANRLDVAVRFATDHGVHVVLKGHRTVIATPTGRAFINPTGNPGDGHRRHRRRPDGHAGGVAGAAARRRSGVSARGVPARRRRRSGRRVGGAGRR